jgi:hypothetical protein
VLAAYRESQPAVMPDAISLPHAARRQQSVISAHGLTILACASIPLGGIMGRQPNVFRRR